ncbi:hypothetical protein ACFQ3K_15425 [Brucella gallinifaecis]|uniref:Uncharacterized protein n=1 Tax=Brucella gallinifaecis TaxID=215590 RepID=A0A502BMK0_9HYPH|nr:hypothetical protein FHY56_11420 [Brucella gallinifaecis]
MNKLATVGQHRRGVQDANRWFTWRDARCFLSKILPLLLLALMALHIIKPLGLPGLKKRSDFWKIAAIAIFAMALVVGLHFSES